MKLTLGKSLLALGALALVAGVGWRWWPKPPVTEPHDVQPGWTVEVKTDPAEVFRRAFWRQPGAGDRIVHAERVEWTEPGSGVAKWQWHLEVEPSAELKEWLLVKNAFGLVPAVDEPVSESASVRRPSWLPGSFRGAKIYRRDTLTVVLVADGGRLFAWDAGHGFAKPQTAAK